APSRKSRRSGIPLPARLPELRGSRGSRLGREVTWRFAEREKREKGESDVSGFGGSARAVGTQLAAVATRAPEFADGLIGGSPADEPAHNGGGAAIWRRWYSRRSELSRRRSLAVAIHVPRLYRPAWHAT
ncbi:unnamed protein product, partial [Ixodes persulcatus]